MTDLQASCQPEAMQQVAAGLPGATVTVKPIPDGPFKTATRYVPAAGALPAYCQVTGSFVTNPKTGKTANFLATLPANWNGKYLQLGCSGHCGQFYVSDPATPSIVITAQGSPGQILLKGYAAFATDEGHVGMDSTAWALTSEGAVDQDFLDDWMYRADRVLADVGKAFTTAFYSRGSGQPARISRSYFNGCSGGGRDALVAASYFPEEFDGIIAGSPYNPAGVSLHRGAIVVAQGRSPDARLTPELLGLLDRVVKARCDSLDGAKDGVIQNPAACDFRPARDLPRCTGGQPASACFTPAQIETASIILSAVTDEAGHVVQPGYTPSELKAGDPTAGREGDATLKVFIHRNDPAFQPASIYSFREGGPGPVTNYHAVVPAAEVDRARSALRLGVGHLPENSGALMRSSTKLLIWHNFSDEALTPYMSINYYKQLAQTYGGYARLQKTARLFLIPGTTHCSISGIAPNSFDALSAMEDWVENGRPPEAIRLSVANHQFTPGAPPAEALKRPKWTGIVCKFPELARYSGKGDMADAANWSCSPKDTRLLQVGEAGRQGGVSP